MVIRIVLGAFTLYAVYRWAWWRFVSMAFVYYMESKEIPIPTDEEMKENIKTVIKNTMMDLTI